MRRERWEELLALAEAQHGAFTTQQAAELEVDGAALQRARSDRLVDRARQGVWAVLALIDDWTVMAALQLAQPRAVAGYRAGAELHHFDGLDEVVMDVLVPRNVRLRGPNVHRVDDLVVPEIVVVDGIRCTDEVRTLIDYAALVDDGHVERAMESVFRRDCSKRALLVDRATALARPGKSGPARALRVESRLPEVPTESDLETVYWQGLVRYGVPLPVRQYELRDARGGVIARFDDAYVDIKLFIELDGWSSRKTREAFGHDRRRQNAAVAHDWTPLRFTDSDVRTYMRRTAHITRTEVERRRARLVADRVA